MSQLEIMQKVRDKIRQRASLGVLTCDLFILAVKCQMALRGEAWSYTRCLPMRASAARRYRDSAKVFTFGGVL